MILAIRALTLLGLLAIAVPPGVARAETPRKIVVVAQGGLARQPLATTAASTGREPYLLRTPDGACLNDGAAAALMTRSGAPEMLIGCAVAAAGTTTIVVRHLHAAGVGRRAGVVEGAGTPDEMARLAAALAAQALGDAPPPAPQAQPSPPPAAPVPAPAAPPPAAQAPPAPAPAAPAPPPAWPAAPPPAPAPAAPAPPPAWPAAPPLAPAPATPAPPPAWPAPTGAAPPPAWPAAPPPAWPAPADAAPPPAWPAAPPPAWPAAPPPAWPAAAQPAPDAPPGYYAPAPGSPAAAAPYYGGATAPAPSQPVTIAAPSDVAPPGSSATSPSYHAIVLFAGSDGFGYGAGYRGQWAVGGVPGPLASLNARLAVGVDVGIATRDAGPAASIGLIPIGLTLKAVRPFGKLVAAARAGVAGVLTYTSVDPAWRLDLTLMGLTGVEAKYGHWLAAFDVLAGKGTAFLFSAGVAF